MALSDLLIRLKKDRRGVFGSAWESEPLTVEPGDRVGVVLLGATGPERAEDVEAVLVRRLQAGAKSLYLVPAFLLQRIGRLQARRHANGLRGAYEQIGGTCPQNRRTREQAALLATRLNSRFGSQTGAEFRTYVADSTVDGGYRQAVQTMRRDGVSKTILVALNPHDSHAIAAHLRRWRRAERAEGIAGQAPSTLGNSFVESMKFAQAISERIEEALQRFPEHMRKEVPLVFSAPAIPLREATKRGDLHLAQLENTVRKVMEHRGGGNPRRAFHLAYQKGWGSGEALSPTLEDILEELADEGHSAVLVVPIAELSDRVGTLYGLDVALREQALGLGLERFEVAGCLNSHELFIDALADSVAERLRIVGPAQQENSQSRQSVQGTAKGVELLLAAETKPDAGRSKAA